MKAVIGCFRKFTPPTSTVRDSASSGILSRIAIGGRLVEVTGSLPSLVDISE